MKWGLAFEFILSYCPAECVSGSILTGFVLFMFSGMEACCGYSPRGGRIRWPTSSLCLIGFYSSGRTDGIHTKCSLRIGLAMPSRCGTLTRTSARKPPRSSSNNDRYSRSIWKVPSLGLFLWLWRDLVWEKSCHTVARKRYNKHAGLCTFLGFSFGDTLLCPKNF